ncbi:LOW QUALITY PROTEIN: C-C chemokine receptor type 9-like [Lampetra planeri]
MADIMMNFTTEVTSGVTPTDDYDYPELLCDRTSVREFRRLYEPPLFWMIAVVGGAGNLAVVWIYLNFQRRLKTMTDVYLLNLAVADLLFLVTLPLWAAEASNGWSFGSAVCKVTAALYKVNMFSSMLLLTCISVDRYIVIVQTTKARNSQGERRRCSRLVCVGVWLLALVLAMPELVFATCKEGDSGSQNVCRMVFPSHVGTRTKILVRSLQVSMGFCLPFLIMTFCYSFIAATLLKTRNFQKHKAMRVILAVVVVFVVSQLPYNTVLVMEAVEASNVSLTDCEQMKHLDKVGQVLKSLAYTHACLNPFLYAFVGVRFRHDMLQLLRCCWRRPAAAAQQQQQHKSNKVPLSSVRASVMSDCDTSQALSL